MSKTKEVEFEFHFFEDKEGNKLVDLQSINDYLEFALSNGRTKKDFRYAIENLYEGIQQKLNEV